ncbi:MAG: xylulose kinase [Spirochaetota bacterium]|nr:MAG: xylulose kinase [Spirochaetota bacterium]
MSSTHVIGVDLGTMGTKAAIFDNNGNLITQAYEETKLYYPRPSWVEQKPEEMYGAAVRTIKKCIEESGVDPSSVAGISCDGQMAGISSVDNKWGTPTPYDSWLDTRCGTQLPRLQEHEDRIIALTGGPPSFTHGAKVLWWMHEHPDIFKKIKKFLMPGAYVAGRLAGLRGELAYIDRTYLHFSCFSDTKAGEWSDELIGLFDVPKDKLPRIVDPWEVIGHVTKEAAAETGLMAGTPIAAGCGDQTANMLGAAMVKPGLVFDVAGTACVFAVCLDNFVTDTHYKTIFTGPLAIPGLYFSFAYMNGAGLNLRWFRDEMASYEKKEAEASGENIYQYLDKMAAEAPPGSDGLILLPHFAGRVCPYDSNTRGIFFGMSWSHTKGHMYRALMEGVAYEYAYYLKIIRSLLPSLDIRETRVIGGGARSRLYNQIKADVLGVPYVTLNREEFAVQGSAILAGYTVGLFDDLAKTAQKFIETADRFKPDHNNHTLYQPLVEEYINLLNVTKPLFDSRSDISEQ